MMYKEDHAKIVTLIDVQEQPSWIVNLVSAHFIGAFQVLCKRFENFNFQVTNDIF